MGRSPALLHERSRTLIISDVHLGYEDSMASHGVFLPRLQLKKAKDVIKEGSRAEAQRLVIDGDLKHVFEKLTKGERTEVADLIRYALEEGYKEVALVRGNHDTFVGPLLKDFGVEVVEDYLDLGDGIIVTHGHKLIDSVKGASAVIIGHEHPSLEINLAGSKVKLQALLRAPLKGGGELIVLPAISLYQTGTSITPSPETYLSPIVKEMALLEDAMPIVVDREIGVIELPTLKELFSGII
ncbi:MAG: metallophosphoesterase [Acidilobus sp.]